MCVQFSYSACVELQKSFSALGLGHILRETVSLASTSFNFFIRNHSGTADIYKLTEELYYGFKECMVGGPVIIVRRQAEVDKSRIRNYEFGSKAKLAVDMTVWDYTGLYSDCLANAAFPVGPYIHRLKADDFKKHFFSKKIHDSVEWLAFCEFKYGLTYQSRFKGQECSLRVHTAAGWKWLHCDGMVQNQDSGKLICLEFIECVSVGREQTFFNTFSFRVTTMENAISVAEKQPSKMNNLTKLCKD